MKIGGVCPLAASMICLHDTILKDVSLPVRELGKRKVSGLSVGEVTRTSEWHS